MIRITLNHMKRESGLKPELYPQLYATKTVVISKPLFAEREGKQTGRKPGDLPYFITNIESSGIEIQEFMTAKFLLLFVLFGCQAICAQVDSIQIIPEVIVSDSQLWHFSNSISVVKLTDSVIKKNEASLTSILKYNTSIYFKENGYGMVSSPSFRGTTAQQTAVIWNGININSQFNGQTDFNTITPGDFNSISVRAGGGSVIYGSGAIGGSIHLNTDLTFNGGFTNDFFIRYGSFNTVNTVLKSRFSNRIMSFQAAISRNNSENDFKIGDSGRRNSNGAYHNTGVNINFGVKTGANSQIKLYSRFYEGQRHFAVVNPTDSKTKYSDSNAANLLEWVWFFSKVESKVKLAYISEQYAYFENIDGPAENNAKSATTIAKYDIAYTPTARVRLNAVLDYSHTNGSGTNIGENERQISSASVLMRHQLWDNLLYEASFRKESTSNYASPFLYSGGITYKPTKRYSLRINASKNFRIPTFNDLYWTNTVSTALRPESSRQVELGNDLDLKYVKFSLTGYIIRLKDMIQWIPGANDQWFPQNLNEVQTYGMEAILNAERKMGGIHMAFNGTYAYTVSENTATHRQLIFVPFHKATATVVCSYAKFAANYQVLFTGEAFTRSDNNPRYNVPSYTVSNLGIDYDLGKENAVKAGFQIRNLLNANYIAMPGRPFPGRNFNIYLNLNI